MAQIKDINKIGAKWQNVTPGRQAEYADGVQNPRADWAQQTQAATNRYNAGVQGAISKGSYSAGVRKAGTAKWQANALAKGPGRWAEGVSLSRDNYIAGFGPYAQVIAATVLPERGPKGDPKNIQRVAVLAKALNDKKNSLAK